MKAQNPMAQPDGPTDKGASAREARRHMTRLHNLSGRLDHQAALIRNADRDLHAEARAGKLNDEAFAIRWALRRIAPETECVRQTLAALHAIGGSP